MKYTKQHPIDNWKDVDLCVKNSKLNFEHLKSIDDEQEKRGEPLLYRYFTRPVADGTAWYQVIKVTSKNVTVQWCDGISLDNYCDGMLGDGEITMPRNVIEPLVRGRIALNKVFSN